MQSASLLIVGALLIFAPLIEGGTTHLATMVIRLMILSLLGLYWASVIRTGWLAWPRMTLGLAVVAYLVLAAGSVAASPYTNQSLQWLLVLLGYATLLYLLVVLLDAWQRVAGLMLVLTAMGLFQAGWALVQWGWLGKARPAGTFFNPNFLAGYLTAIASLVLAFLCCVRRRAVTTGGLGWLRFAAPAGLLGLLVLLSAAVVVTGSRGGALALLVGTGVVLGLRFGRKGAAVLALFVLVGAAVPNPVRDRIVVEHVANPVAYARWQMWDAALREMASHPFGVGLGLYQYVYPRHAFPVEGEVARYGKIAQTPHSEYLQMGVELGAASLLLFGWGVLLVVREAAGGLRGRLRRWQRGVLVGAVAGVASILVHAAVDSNLHEPAVAIVLTLFTAVLLSIGRLARAAKPSRPIPVRSRLVWASVGVLVLTVGAVQVLRIGFGWMAYEEGLRAAARQDLRTAISQYARAAALDPGKALYRSALAAVYFQGYERTGRVEAAQAAAEALETAIALNPLDGRLPALLGHVHATLAMRSADSDDAQRTARLRAALTAYRQAAELEPFSPQYAFELGRLHLALGEGDRAEASVLRAVEVEPNFLPGREWLARQYLATGRVEAAEREYQEILARQQRFAGRPKGSLEERFLAADTAALEAGLIRARART